MMFNISLEGVIIVMLLAYIVGLLTGVTVNRPRSF